MAPATAPSADGPATEQARTQLAEHVIPRAEDGDALLSATAGGDRGAWTGLGDHHPADKAEERADAAAKLAEAAASLAKARQQPRATQMVWAVLQRCDATALGYDYSL